MRRSLSLIALALCLFACKVEQPASDTAATNTDTAAPAASAPSGDTLINYVAVNQSVFVPMNTIDGWINANPPNDAAIDDHAWDLWTAINVDSGQSYNGTPLPVWETWYDATVVYKTDEATAPTASADAAQQGGDPMATMPKRRTIPQRRFHRPNQFFKGHAPADSQKTARATPTGNAGLLLTFNRFTEEMRKHVWDNSYYLKSKLDSVNSGWNASTPVADRAIQPFPNTSIMTKPVFWIISGTQPTMVPYWNGLGSNASTDAQNPKNQTWKQCVLADPTGTAKNDVDRVCNQGQPGQTTMKAGTYQVVRVNANPANSAFYAFQLTQQEVDDLEEYADELGNSNTSNPKAGDFALLVAMHVSTREIDNWTWQSFWWQPAPNVTLPADPPTAMAPPSSVPKPWNMYAGCSAYYMVNPPGAPNGTGRLCYNPYLETDLTGLKGKDKTGQGAGVQSNCMTCHRAAAWRRNSYAIAFQLNADDKLWFGDNTKLDFAWSMQNFAH